jgi:hypothetical protein
VALGSIPGGFADTRNFASRALGRERRDRGDKDRSRDASRSWQKSKNSVADRGRHYKRKHAERTCRRVPAQAALFCEPPAAFALVLRMRAIGSEMLLECANGP